MSDPEEKDELADVIHPFKSEEGESAGYASVGFECEGDIPDKWKDGLATVMRENFAKPFRINPKCFRDAEKEDDDDIDD